LTGGVVNYSLTLSVSLLAAFSVAVGSQAQKRGAPSRVARGRSLAPQVPALSDDYRYPSKADLTYRLKTSAPSVEEYQRFRKKASLLFKEGVGSASTLFETFLDIYGESEQALLLFLYFAELAPLPSLRTGLLAAAGFAAPSDSEPDSLRNTAGGSGPMHGHKEPAGPPQRRDDAPSGGSMESTPPPQSQPSQFEAPASIFGDMFGHAATPAHDLEVAPHPVRRTAAPAGADVVSGAAPAVAKTDVSEEEALEALGLKSEIWGVDNGFHKHAGTAKTKRKRAETTVERPSVIYWIRQDFRLHDNPALCQAYELATARGGRVYCIYVHAPGEASHA
jgi:DNA photolyase